MAARVSETKAKMLLEEPIHTLIPKMAIPTILAQLITTIYNLVDTYFVSSLGTNATAAVGVNASLEQGITLIGTLIGVGTSSYVARLLGAKNQKKADEVLSTALFTGVIAGLFVAVIGSLNMVNMVNFLGATDDCRIYSMQYAAYVLCAAPFIIVSFILNQCLRSEGSATLALVGIGFGGILNCFLDPLFIFKLDLGVSGASMATAISKVVSCVILIFPYLAGRSIIKMSVRKIHFVKTDIVEVVSIGISSFLRSGLGVVATTAMNHVAGGYSTSVLAAVSVANRVMNFPFAVVLGFGQGFQPVVGYNWGAKRLDRAKESFRFSSIISLAVSAVIGVFLFIFAKGAIHLFSDADSEMMRIGALCIRLQCITLPVHAWVSVINMLYAGIGKPKQALILSTARQGYCLLPLLLILPSLFGVNGIAACQATADALTLFAAVPLAIIGSRMLDDSDIRN